MQTLQCVSSSLAASQSVALRGSAPISPASAPCAPKLPQRRSVEVVAMAGKKKIISNLTDWKKEFIGYGIFVEDSESKPVNVVKTLEDKKLLSGVEQLGLLSTLEGFGLSLSKIEQLKLLSTAEKLGVLSLLEEAAIKGPGFFASLSLPLLAGAILVPLIVPDDSTALEVAQYTVAALLALGSVLSFGTSIALGLLLE